MSLILGYANKDNAIIMSDGRAGVNGCYSEYYNKTQKINANIIIGFAGFVESGEKFIKDVLLQIAPDIENYFIDDFLDMISFLLDDKCAQEHFHSSFIIIGRDKSGQMHTAIIGNCTTYKLQLNQVTTPRFLAIGGTISGSEIINIYIENLKNNTLPIEKRMENTILQVSRLDNSINRNIFYVIL